MKYVFLAIFLATGLSTSFAQDSLSVKESSKPVVSGYADVYYRYNYGDSINNYTSFTNSQNSFELGMISLKIEQNLNKVGFVGDLGFGKRAQDFSYNDANSMLIVKQLFVTYSPVENLKFTAGSWATHIGYEGVDPTANKNYSMSYMFSYGPFFHTGLKAEYVLGKNTFVLGVVNPTDLKSANFAKKYVVGQWGSSLAKDRVKFYLNGLAGKSVNAATNSQTRNNQFDLVVSATVTDKFSVGYNGTIANLQTKADANSAWSKPVNWLGSALYFNYDVAKNASLNLRTEYFEDNSMITSVFALPAQGGHVYQATLSANIKIKNLVIIPEIRVDNSNKDIFYKSNGNGLTGTTVTNACAVVYKF